MSARRMDGRRHRSAAVLLAAGSSLAGCAERQLVAAPRSDPTAAEWLAVGFAAGVVALLWGALLNRAAWHRATRAPLAVWVLSATTGAVLLGGAVLVGVALRSWQLLDRPAERDPAPALLRVSRVDGDTAFYALMVLVVVVLTGLLVLLLALSARWAASDDGAARVAASAVLGMQVLLGVGAAGVLATGSDAWPYVVLAGTTPLTAAALATCWPTRRST